MMIILNIIIIPVALFLFNYLTKNFNEKKTVPERILSISLMFLSGLILYLATDGLITWLF
jgi:hypothetical protein